MSARSTPKSTTPVAAGKFVLRPTRRKLLAAAERIFARDGFEAARLEDIASRPATRAARFMQASKARKTFFSAFSNTG